MNRGAYRYRITFQTATETPDGQGGATVALTTLATQWGSVIALSGDRLMRMQQIVMGSWFEIETNYRPDLYATIQLGNPVLYEGRTLYPKFYEDVDERRTTWKITAYEKR